MKLPTQFSQQTFPQLASIVMTLGLLLLIAGVTTRFMANQSTELTSSAFNASLLTERELAIDVAKAAGQKDYTFTSNFVPGIGRIADPEQYKNQALNELKNFKPNLP